MMKLVVLSCLLAAASATVLPFGYGAPYAYGAPLAYGAYGAPWFGSNYRGPLSLAPGQPANILGADGRPLDTLEVNLDRSAHIVSKAYNGGVHLLKKRSLIAPIGGRVALAHAPLVAPVAPVAVARYSHIAPYSAYAAPYSYLI